MPWENIGGRAEFLTFSLDGTTHLTDPRSWFSREPLRTSTGNVRGLISANSGPR